MADRVHKVTLTADVSGFKRSMTEAADATKKIGSSADESSSKGSTAFEKLGGVAGKVLGAAAIAGAAKAILDVGLSYESSLNGMQAVTSATGEEMAKVSELAKQLGNDINIPGASASDAAEAMTELAKGGLTLQESMAAAKGTLQLATAAQISGAEAATIQADALNAFNLEATEAGHVSDLLANAANAATGDIGDFAQGLAQSSAVANGLGISIDENVAVLGLFANAGIKGSDAGTSFKTMLTQLQNPTDKAAAAMEELGITAFDAEGNFVGMRTITEQLAVAQQNMSTQAFSSAAGIVFGSDAIRGATVLASGGVTAYDQMATALSKTGGAAQLAAAQAQGLPGAFANIKNQAESVALSLYEQVSPALAGLLNDASDVLPAVGEFFGDVVTAAAGFIGFITDLPGPVLAAGAALATIAVVKDPVSDAFKSIGKNLTEFKTKVAEATAASAPLAASITPVTSAMSAGGASATVLAEGLKEAAGQAKGSQSALDSVKAAASPLEGALTGAAGAASTLVGGLAETQASAGNASSAVTDVVAAAEPLADVLLGGGDNAGILAEGLAAAGEKARDAKGGVDGVSESVSPLGDVLSGAGDASVVLGEGLAGTAASAGDAAGAVGETTEAADPLAGALEGAGLSAEGLGEGLSTASDKAKDMKSSGGGAAGAVAKIGAAGKIAGAGLMAAFGGPVGLAITGVTLALGFLGDAFNETEPVASDFTSVIDDQTGSLKANSDAIVEKTLAESGALQTATNAGITAERYTQAVQGNKAALDEVNAALAASTYDVYDENLGAISTQTDTAAAAQRQLTSDTENYQKVLDAAAVKNYAVLMEDVGTSMDGARSSAAAAFNPITGVGTALGQAERSAAALPAVQEDVNKAWEDGAIDAGELTKQVQAVMLAQDQLAGRNGDAEAAQRAFNASAVEYNNLILDQSLNSDHLAEAEQRVRDAQTTRDEVQKNLNKSTEDGGTTQADLDRANRDVAASTVDLAKEQQNQKLSGDQLTETQNSLKSAMLTNAQVAVNNAAATGNVAGAHAAAAQSVQNAKDSFIAMQSPTDIASGKAKNLADQLFGIPEDVATTVVAETLTAQQRLEAIKGQMDALRETVTVKVVTNYVTGTYGGSVGKNVDDATAMIGRADGGMFEHGRPVQHAADGLSRMVKGGANLVHWAEPETVWESFISGKPSQRTRNHGLMVQTANRLGGTYIPPGSTPQRFANGGLNEGAQRSFMGSSVVNNTRGGATYQISVTNTTERRITVDELVGVVRQAERSGRL